MIKKISLQWRITVITALFIAFICGCVTLFVYSNGVYYMESLNEVINSQINESGEPSEIYIDITVENWEEFADDFSSQVYKNKFDYKRRSLLFSTLIALCGGVVTYFICGHSLKPLKDFSNKIEEVQAENLSDSSIEENKIKELNQLSISYNKMLERLLAAFNVQRQFTANVAHELRTPLSLMQLQIDLYNSTNHKNEDEITKNTMTSIAEQNEKLIKIVKILLEMSEFQMISRDDRINVSDLIEEVVADLQTLAQERKVKVTAISDEVSMKGSDILIYRMVYNLVENAIKYNKVNGQVLVMATQNEGKIIISVKDTGNGIPEQLKERVFEPFFRVDKSRNKSLGGIGLGLALVSEIVRLHEGSIKVEDSSEGGTNFEVIF